MEDKVSWDSWEVKSPLVKIKKLNLLEEGEIMVDDSINHSVDSMFTASNVNLISGESEMPIQAVEVPEVSLNVSSLSSLSDFLNVDCSGEALVPKADVALGFRDFSIIVDVKNYDWKVIVLKWRALLLEPGSFWGVTPSFFLFKWWQCYFSLEIIRHRLDVHYNWMLVDTYPGFNEDLSTNILVDASSSLSSLGSEECGTTNYYVQFEDMDYDDVVHSFVKIFTSVKRCLNGDLERFSMLEQIDREIIEFNIGENCIKDISVSGFKCVEGSSGLVPTAPDFLNQCVDVLPCSASSSGTGTLASPSLNSLSSEHLLIDELGLIASSFGFSFPSLEELWEIMASKL